MRQRRLVGASGRPLNFTVRRQMKRFELDKHGQLVPVPEGQEPRDKRWTVRAGFVYLSALVLLAFIVWLAWSHHAA